MYDNLRYFFEFRDLRTSFHRWRVEIHQDPELGAATATELTAADVPVRIEYPHQDFYAPIWPTVCTITVIDRQGDMAFRHLYLAGKNAYYVKVWDQHTLTRMFEGFIVPELYEEAYLPAPYEVRLHASNQLARLQDFRPAIDLKAKRYWSLIEILDMCLRNGTGLSLDMHVQVNIWEERHLRSATMLDETFVVAESMVEDQTKGKDAQEIAENILSAIGARVFYDDGAWVVQRYVEQGRITRTVKYKHTTLSAAVLQNGMPNAISWPLPGNKFQWANSSQVLQSYPPRQSIEVNMDRDVRLNMMGMKWAGAGFASGDHPYDLGDILKTEHWYTIQDIQVEERYYVNVGGTVLFFPGISKYNLVGDAIATQKIKARNAPLKFQISLTFFWEATGSIDLNRILSLRLRMQLGDKYPDAYYVTPSADGGNGVTQAQFPHFHEIQVALKDLPSGQPYTVTYDVNIPSWGTQLKTDEVTARLDIMKPDIGGANAFTVNFAIVDISFSQKEAASREDNTLFAEIDTENTYAEAPKRSLFYYDSFEYLQNCLFLKDAVSGNHMPTRRWEQDSEPGRYFPLAVQTVRELFQTWGIANNVLSGALTTDYRLTLLTTFDETYLGVRMMVTGLSADLRNSSYEVTLQEFHTDTIE